MREDPRIPYPPSGKTGHLIVCGLLSKRSGFAMLLGVWNGRRSGIDLPHTNELLSQPDSSGVACVSTALLDMTIARRPENTLDCPAT